MIGGVDIVVAWAAQVCHWDLVRLGGESSDVARTSFVSMTDDRQTGTTVICLYRCGKLYYVESRFGKHLQRTES